MQDVGRQRRSGQCYVVLEVREEESRRGRSSREDSGKKGSERVTQRVEAVSLGEEIGMDLDAGVQTDTGTLVDLRAQEWGQTMLFSCTLLPPPVNDRRPQRIKGRHHIDQVKRWRRSVVRAPEGFCLRTSTKTQ
jgi:hypothetical protein